jgi:hypothetical protein
METEVSWKASVLTVQGEDHLLSQLQHLDGSLGRTIWMEAWPDSAKCIPGLKKYIWDF